MDNNPILRAVLGFALSITAHEKRRGNWEINQYQAIYYHRQWSLMICQTIYFRV